MLAAIVLVACSPAPGAGKAGAAGAVAHDASDGGSSGRDGSGGGGAADGGPELRLSPILFSPLGEPVLDLVDGGDAPLHAPPQGGHVLRLGARIEGLDNAPDYPVRITSRVRNPDTNAILVEDSRTAVTAEDPERPGARISDRRTDSQFSHAALCPAYGELDVVDASYLLELEVEELYADQTTGRVVLEIIPRCTAGTAADQAACRCECERDYVLGRCARDTDAAPGP